MYQLFRVYKLYTACIINAILVVGVKLLQFIETVSGAN